MSGSKLLHVDAGRRAWIGRPIGGGRGDMCVTLATPSPLSFNAKNVREPPAALELGFFSIVAQPGRTRLD